MASNIIYVFVSGWVPQNQALREKGLCELLIKEVLPGQTGEGEGDTKQIGEEARQRCDLRGSCGG